MSHHPLLWGPDRLPWLAGSPLVGQLAGRQAQVAEDTEALLVAGANDLELARRYLEATGTELVTPGSVGWAAAILLSRSFSLDLSEEEPLEGDMGYFGTWTAPGPNVLALVPWADMLQHCSSAGPESCAAYQFELAAVTLSSHRDYRPGQTVQDSHGQHLSPVDLFLDYGVEDAAAVADLTEGTAAAGAAGVATGVTTGAAELMSVGPAAAPAVEGGEPPESTSGGEEAGVSGVGRFARHRYDADPAEVVAPRSARNAALLRALAAVQGEGSRLALGARGPDTASLTYLRAALATDAELVRSGWRVKATDQDVELACRVMGALAEPSSATTERALLEALGRFAEAALGRFPTSLEEDVARLAGGAGGCCQRLEGPERLAVVAVASQKRALHGTRAAVAGWLARLAAGCDVAELYYDEDEEYDEWGEEEGGEGEGEEGEDEGGWGSRR